MAEWLKAHAWKACIGETLSRVRIPLSPPEYQERPGFCRSRLRPRADSSIQTVVVYQLQSRFRPFEVSLVPAYHLRTRRPLAHQRASTVPAGENSGIRELVPRLPMLIVMPPVENCLHAFPHLVRHHRPKESTEARALHMWIRGRTLIRGAFAILPLLSGDRDHLELTAICRPLTAPVC